MKADGHTGKDIAKYFGVSHATRYRYLAEDAAGERASLAAYVPAGEGKCLIVLDINIDSHSAKTPAGRCCTWR